MEITRLGLPDNRKYDYVQKFGDFTTFDDFVRKASRMYSLPFIPAKNYILNRLKEKRLTEKDVVCYINWAGQEQFTFREIGKELNIAFQNVYKHLQKVKRVWPYLFNFGANPKHNFAKNKEGRECRISIEDLDHSEIVRKF